MGNRTSSLESLDDLHLELSKKKKFINTFFCLSNFRSFQRNVNS